MKKALIFTLFILVSNICYSESSGNGKYKRGDCITPTNPSYDWYNKYALVRDFTYVKGYGFGEKTYILSGLKIEAIFNKSIELHTKKVDAKNCY